MSITSQKSLRLNSIIMNGEPMKYDELQKKYGGGFVAFLNGEVVVYGKTFSEVLDKAEEKGVLEDENLIFDFIEEEGAICVYTVSRIQWAIQSGGASISRVISAI